MPSSPYRNDSRADILRERCVAMANELAAITARRAEERNLRAREEELRGELARMRIELAQHTRLPLLSNVKVASPCSASWDTMIGDEKTRFCGSCAKNVHNLSAMTAHEAEQLLGGAQENGGLCVRFFQRADGTVMTSDCSVGVKKKRVRRLAVLALGAGAGAAAMAMLASENRAVSGAVSMGEPMPFQGEMTAPMGAPVPTSMGSVAPPQDPPPPPPHVTGGIQATHTMGKVRANVSGK